MIEKLTVPTTLTHVRYPITLSYHGIFFYSKPITLQAFVYRSIIECFVNDGHVFTIRAYDYPKGKLSLSVDNGSVNVEELVVKVAE